MTPSRLLRKRLGLLAAPFLYVAAAGALLSCEDNAPTVGSALASGEVQIAIDTLTWNGSEQNIHRGDQTKSVSCPLISYSSVFDDAIDARSTTNLLGRISVPEYGDLNCSFVSRLMCTSSLSIPDSIPIQQVDSMKLVFTVPRGALTGDSLVPQQLRVFELTESLPNDIDNRFNPSGYYNPEKPLGTRSFTLSALGMSDSLYLKSSYIDIEIPMSRDMAVRTVNAYRNEETRKVFAWPQSFEKYFHGIYVEPSFGRGCVANIAATTFVIYYSYRTSNTSTGSDGTTTTTVQTKVGASWVFGASPIVLSSNNVIYSPSEYLKAMHAKGDALVTAPGGYRIDFRFPGRELIDIFRQSQSKLAVVSNLSFSIPAEEISNDYGITPPPYLVMVKSSRLEDFFKSNSLPDGKDSFYAAYDAGSGRYSFSSMRSYILDLIQNGVEDEDLDFTIVPANIEFETDQSSSTTSSYDAYLAMLYGYGYGSSSSSSTSSEPIKCTPYISKPSMCRLKMDEARTIFTYSVQQMR